MTDKVKFIIYVPNEKGEQSPLLELDGKTCPVCGGVGGLCSACDGTGGVDCSGARIRTFETREAARNFGRKNHPCEGVVAAIPIDRFKKMNERISSND